ncbi:MAG: SDR family NAD(P)-dependent oxidoreductase [Nitrososphaerales archaeon]
MKTSKAIVTGGAGFIGSHIVDELINRGIETIVIDDFSTGSLENLKSHKNNSLLSIVVGDIKEIKHVLRDIDGVDTVFHEAAIVSVPRSVHDPMLVHDVNVNGTLEVMNFCVSKHVRRFVFASSASVYGIVNGPYASEELICAPSSPYGASKFAVEAYISAFYRTYGLEGVMLRYFNVYGPRQKNGDYSGVITVLTNNLLQGKRPVIYGDGLQTRDFVNVKDIVQANMLAMESEVSAGETFNVASGNSTSVLQLFEKLRTLTETRDIQHRFAPPRPGDVARGAASIAKIKNVLGYAPSIDLNDGLNELVKSVGIPAH